MRKIDHIFSRSCFCLNQLAYRYHRTKPMMKFLFHPVYRYIFCLPSRRSRQIIGQALEIIYSFLLLCFNRMFIRTLFCFFLFFFCLTALSVVFFFFWVRTTTFFWIYWHVSHSFESSTVTPFESHLHIWHGHIPSISEWFCTEQWQRQLQVLHLVSVIFV